MPGRVLAPMNLALLVGLFACFLFARPAMPLPGDFQDSLVADVPAPTALAFTPDGRMLVTSKSGKLWVRKDGQATLALDLGPEVCANSERGLLGAAVDLDFGTTGNNHVYLYYTYKKFGRCPAKDPGSPHNPVNRVSRFIMSGDTVDPNSEEVLIDNIPSPNGNHNGGDLKFGKDGYLYVSVGDGGCDYAERTRCQYENDASRDRHILLGKVLRITESGGIPTDNPFQGSDSARCAENGRTMSGKVCQEIFALGFRNPFRMAFDPDSAKFHINDVGGQRWEEIDLGRIGADYGWNLCEGRHDNPYRGGQVNCSGPNYTGPIHEYSHASGCESVTGGAFVPDGFWPTEYDESYLFGDYVCGKIFELRPGVGEERLFASGLGGGGPVAMDFGPYKTTGKALYYTTFAGGGQVRRIAYTEGNLAPVAVAETADGKNYSSSLTIDFDGSKSSDPDNTNEQLAYEWDFDGNGTVDSTVANPEPYTYPSAGKYTATLTVRDAQGKVSEPDRIEVFPGNTPPEPVVGSPASGEFFGVGEEIRLSGTANDTGDGQLMDGELSWEVLQHHDGNHAHPVLGPESGNDLTFTAPAPEGLFSTDPTENYLEIRLTATDSQGLSKTVTRQLRPKTVEVVFETQPLSLRLKVNGETFAAPRTFVSWEGYALNVSAPRQKDRRGRTWVLYSWSDGGARDHTITTPTDPTTYTAVFRRLRR